ncbi:uncharacterized protein LOC118193640, partial [Stegodyphus dumicola]|uniref:uncharacterized protein LOC118193640 n=1 Tax=Stegodyphus dumicola TaxID=202533 RepID=UPI0015AD3E2C
MFLCMLDLKSKMSLNNIYLKETKLTSTKNKFLFHSAERLREDLINCENFLLDEKERKRKIKTDPLHIVFEEAIPIKKKKKKEKTRAARFFHERSISRECEDQFDDVDLDARFLRSSPRDGFRAAVAACHYTDESVLSELGTTVSEVAVQPRFAGGAITSFSADLASNLRNSPHFSPMSPGFSNTVLSFGSSAMPSTFGANAKPLLRKSVFTAKQTSSEGFSGLFGPKVLVVNLFEMPAYSFSLEEGDDTRTAEKITSLDLDEDYLLRVNKIRNLKIKK